MSKYFIFATVALSLLLSSISGSAVSVAFPHITESFNTSLILAGWVLSVYQLVATAAMPLAGKAGDILGAKKLFLISVALFTVGSVLSALAPNIGVMIFARFVQAVGGGGFLPLATVIVAEQFPDSRQQAIGLFSSIFPIGQIIGPNLGAWLTDSFGWKSIFWFNLPFGIAVLIISWITLKPSKTEAGKMDLIGAGLFSGALTALMIALGDFGKDSSTSVRLTGIALLALAAVLMLLFLRHENHAKEPFIDLAVLKEKPFMAANSFNFLFGVCVFGIMSFVPLYGVSIYNMTTLESGLILTPRSIGMIAASSVTSLSIKRWGYRNPMLIGVGITALCLVLLGLEPGAISIAGISVNSLSWMIFVMLLLGLGMGVAMPAANNACIELMPNRIATITGVRGMFRQTGGAVSISVVTLLLSNLSSMAVGFRVAFIGMAAILLGSVPLIFAMPRACAPSPAEEAQAAAAPAKS